MIDAEAPLAKGIRRAFEKSGLTLTEFAERAGVSISTAHGWVHGTHDIRGKHLPKVAKALGTSVSKLVA